MQLAFYSIALVAVILFSTSILHTTLNPDHTLYWHGLPWFAHTDHWHIFLQVNTFFDSLFWPQASDTIFSRLPSLFPDLLLASAIHNFLHPFLSQDSLVAFLILNVTAIFLIVYAFVFVLLRQTRASFLATLLSLSFLHRVLPFTNFIYIPIHHGGNVFNTLAGFALHLNVCRLTFQKRYTLAFGNTLLLCALFLISTYSNRLFIFSALIPILYSSFLPFFRRTLSDNYYCRWPLCCGSHFHYFPPS